MNNERNKTMKNWISVTISVVAFVISIFALAIVIPTDLSKDGLDFDYIGAIIGVLSFLVTLLIGYQIYTVINVKEELKELREVRSNIDQMINEKVNSVKEQTNEELNNLIPLLMSLDIHDNVGTVVTALEVFDEAMPDTLAYTFSDGLIFSFMRNVVDYGAKEKEVFIGKLKERANYKHVVKFYAHISALPEEEKCGSEGVEALMVKLISMYVDAKDE